MRKQILFVMMILALILAGGVLAQDGNDPADNWCFDGGPLEGRCTTNDPAETAWYWYYGFYRAQVAKGAISVNDVPEEYRIGFESVRSTAPVLDEDGNVVTALSPNFQGTISTCRSENNSTLIEAIWVGLERPGDRIEISIEEGSLSRNMYIPTSAVDVRFRFNKVFDSVTPGGTMRVYYRGVLIGESNLAGLNDCL